MERVCWNCGNRYDDDLRARCDCGEPLWLPLHEHSTGNGEAPAWPDAVTAMWDFADFLPEAAPPGVGAVAGGTPLVRTASLDEEVGARVHVKVEGANPTGSFKDRGTAVGVAAALARDESAVGTVSHGNMAASVAAHAAAADLDCYVLVPADIPTERLGNIAQYDPTLVRVDGDYGRLYEESLRLGREAGVRFINSDDPLRVAGQGSTTLELCHALGPAGPDAVVMPVSSGGHASGAWQALETLAARGLADEADLPRLYFVQAAACAPIAEAYERGDDEVTPVEAGETVAYSIANANPPSGNRALAAARATGGAVLAVDDDEILAARERLATAAGLSVEPASATTLAAARRLGDEDVFDDAADVALVATGRGYGAAGEVEATTVGIDDLDEVLP